MLQTRILLPRLTCPLRRYPPKWRPHRFQRSSSTQAPASPSPTVPPKRRLFRASYIWYGLVLLTGASLGFTVRNFAAPLPLPLPGSREDELAMRAITSDIEGLDVVKFMRSQGYHLHADTPLRPFEQDQAKAAHKGWTELDIKTNIVESKEDWGSKSRTLTGGSLAGSRGLGVQRAFWNAETRELVAVVWIGGALCGWPGLAHGGAIATIFGDCMSRMVAGPGVSIDSIPEPTSMSVTYAKPTNSTNFYILRAHFSKPHIPPVAPPPDPDPAPAKSWLPSWKDLTKKEQPTENKKAVEIIGTLEDTNGNLCVRVKGTYPVSA
ncbi:hypothetical protein K458DRAFT_128400 [Lentithecium fluviatile CBS 122367]|uniref:Thioesterase domain-containing protein n=1 Tax=Lentithecium fluviatile CBS 122367 TaxID=1168545 RepID=A0A6G1JFZ9_9PLEO|nr:hypothetical protein K458DRAFT_128400 [Lentithecium fluviatile CBS 122367]